MVFLFFPSMPNAHKSPKGDYDVIHCAHCLSKNRNKPWVADIEYPGQIWVIGTSESKNEIKHVKKILLRKNCKKIITWTELMKKSLLELIPEIKDKVEVIFPPIPRPKVQRKKHKGINLFFVARYFYSKGGLHALEVMDRLTKKYSNVKGIIVSEVPLSIQQRYSKNKNLKFLGLMSQKELFSEVYSIGDIFLYPGYSDSFGFAIPEVMSLGIPVISVDLTTRKELLENGKNGFLVEMKKKRGQVEKKSTKLDGPSIKEVLRQLEKKTEQLIKNPKMLKLFSKNAKRKFNLGDFSEKKIQEKMKKIYLDAAKE